MSLEIPKLHRQCKICKKVKKNVLFTKFGLTRGDFTDVCKACEFNSTNTKHLILPRKIDIYDYVSMYELLKNIGYEGKDIHEQFCERWGLEPIEREELNEFPYEEVEKLIHF